MYRAILVDDEEHIRNLLAKNIREADLGVEVAAVAGDGREALQAAIDLKPDIVITDISMPFMNGLELINELQQAEIHSKYVIISGYDEFDYARQAISLGVTDYLLKPFLPKELRDVICKLVQELDHQKALQQNMMFLREQALSRAGVAREKALKDLLEGRDCQTTEIDWQGDFFLAGIVDLKNAAWDFSRQESIEEFLLLIREGYFSSDVAVYAVSFDGIRLAMLWSGHSENETAFFNKIKSGIEKIQASLDKYYQISLTCALGRPRRSYPELAKSYQEALAVWRGILEAGTSILFYGKEEERKAEVSAGDQIRDWKNQIRLSVKTGQAQAAQQQLQNLMKCYAALSNRADDYIGVSVRDLVYVIQNDMESAGYDREEIKGTEDIQRRINFGSLIEIKVMLEHYIEKCCMIVSEHSEETKASAVVKQIKMLIDHNIKDSTLDLEWVAARVHFSGSYVRQIFKQYTGESVGEYLIRKRMEQAVQLLLKTGMKIQDVAAECGYDDQRYFASSFKKYYKCTPTEFKKAMEVNRDDTVYGSRGQAFAGKRKAQTVGSGKDEAGSQ